MIVFKYHREKFGILRPVADVVVKAGNLATTVFMYIDSGADISMVPRRTGVAIGLKKEHSQIKEMKGIAGEGVPYIEKIIKFVLSESEELEAPVAWALTESVPQLLGRKGIFNKFKIVFDEAAETIEFQRQQ